MKVDDDKQQVDLQHEGGEDAGEAPAKSGPPSKVDRYKERSDNFNVTDCGLNTDTGINRERGCTDIVCVVLFLVFVSSMFGVALYGMSKGEPKALIKPYDFTESICGVNSSVKDYGKLFFTKLAPDYSDALSPENLVRRIVFEEAVCVKECPAKKGGSIACPAGEKYKQKCNKADIPKTTSVMDLCWPSYKTLSKTEKHNWELVMKMLKDNPVFMQAMNLYTAWRAILFSFGSALILCIIYIYFMSIFAQYLAWGIIFTLQILLVLFALGSFYYWKSAEASSENKNLALIMGIVFALLAIIMCICIYCGWNQLKLAISIVDASADFLAQTKRLLIVPIMYFVILASFFLFWLGCIISVESMGKIVPDPNGTVYVPLKKEIKWSDRKEQGKIVNYMLAFLIFGLIWFTFFLKASSNYVVMVAAATYYFTSNTEAYGSGELGTGLKWAWVNNFGSLAFGSLIVAIIFTIRVIAYYICKKAEKASGDNAFVKCISCMVQCFLKCLEEIIEYINRAAYAFMAIAGQSFCSSAYNGLLLQMKHGAKFAFANLLAALFVFLGKIGLTVLNIFITWLFMKHVTGTVSEVSNPYAPLIIVGVFTFLIVSVFLGLFDESVLAMMTSCTADMDLHNGSCEWGPETLHSVLREINGDDDDKKGGDKEVNVNAVN